jgi:PTS system nitrogen regulatory IIA component
MSVNEIITPERVVANIGATSKKRCLEIISDIIARSEPKLSSVQVLASLVQRERLGPTAIGNGVALPHGRIEGLTMSLGAFVRLREPIDYGTSDHDSIDLLFAVLNPNTDQHCTDLAELAERFRDPCFCQRLRSAKTGGDLYRLLSDGARELAPTIGSVELAPRGKAAASRRTPK